MKKIFFVLASGLLLLFAVYPRAKADGSGNPQQRWQTITAKEAHRMMEESDSYVLLDVRTEAEFREKRIDGAVLIPDAELKNRSKAELPDKKAVILIYCRSGRRSALAAAILAELGYSNVYDLGGIINWPYKTVSG